MLPANFIERRQSVKEITCDLIQVARAGAIRTGRWWEERAARAEMGGASRTGRDGSGGSGGRSIVFISHKANEGSRLGM